MRDIPSRVTWLMGLLAVGLLLLGFQLYRLTIAQSATWRTVAEQNMIRKLPSYGPRGNIYDRNGRALATSEPAYAAVLIDQDPAHIDQFLRPLTELLTTGDTVAVKGDTAAAQEGDIKAARKMEQTIRKKLQENIANWRQFEPIVLKRNLNAKVVSTFQERQGEFPGVQLVKDSTRSYPNGPLAGALLGYVRSIQEDQLKEPYFADYSGTEIVGQDGLERQWEHELRGKPGESTVIVDQLGKPVTGPKETPAQPGNSLTLTLDARLQQVAEEALAKQIAYIKSLHDPHADPGRAALVVQEVKTGAILAMVSLPTYDPNVWVSGDGDEISKLLTDERGPLVNWALSGFAPGSTYKMSTGLAGLQAGVLGPTEIINCPSEIEKYGRIWKNWTSGQGPSDIKMALAESCNPFFWTVGDRLGIDRLAEFNQQFGFGRKTGIDTWGEQAGVLPTQASYGNRYQPGESLNVAIGQGDVLVTPLQLVNYVATIANSGVRYQPYLVAEVRDAENHVVKRTQPTQLKPVEAKPEYWKLIQGGMWEGANKWYGTASVPFAGFPNITVGGKTGSAETSTGHPHALSVAYAPFDDPQIAVSVIIEGGSTGSWTVPVIRRVMAQYFGIKDVIPPEVPTYRDAPAPTTNPNP